MTSAARAFLSYTPLWSQLGLEAARALLAPFEQTEAHRFSVRRTVGEEPLTGRSPGHSLRLTCPNPEGGDAMKDCSIGRALRPGFLAAAVLAALMLLPATASSQKPSVRDAVSTFEFTQNMHPMGYSPFANTPNLPGMTFTANSDLAFQGKYAFQGHYIGFRIIDISSSANPREVSFTDCNGNQGDLVVYGDILVRSWNSPAPAGATCDGEPVPTGFEGLHIFDISNVRNPELVGSVEISARPGADAVGCGSHTVTAIPDPDNDRLVIYNQSGGSCLSGTASVHVFEIPLDDPSSPTSPEPVPLTGTAAFPA
ncbi:MAG TPA: hypothetical protein VFY91_17230, partial [Microbacterium sp.]|nr:hypothetical protein [Microbacterium sp.]